jgi:hypothetical protein
LDPQRESAEDFVSRHIARAAALAALVLGAAAARAGDIDPSSANEPPTPKGAVVKLWHGANQVWHLSFYQPKGTVAKATVDFSPAPPNSAQAFFAIGHTSHVNAVEDGLYSGFTFTGEAGASVAEVTFGITQYTPPTSFTISVDLALHATSGGANKLTPKEVAIGAKSESPQGTTFHLPAKPLAPMDGSGKPTFAGALGANTLATWIENGTWHIEANPPAGASPWQIMVMFMNANVGGAPLATNVTIGPGGGGWEYALTTTGGKGSVSFPVAPVSAKIPCVVGVRVIGLSRDHIFVGTAGKHPDAMLSIGSGSDACTDFWLAVPPAKH